jgi:hypothetical protein
MISKLFCIRTRGPGSLIQSSILNFVRTNDLKGLWDHWIHVLDLKLNESSNSLPWLEDVRASRFVNTITYLGSSHSEPNKHQPIAVGSLWHAVRQENVPHIDPATTLAPKHKSLLVSLMIQPHVHLLLPSDDFCPIQAFCRLLQCEISDINRFISNYKIYNNTVKEMLRPS